MKPGAGEGILAEASLSIDIERQGRREEQTEAGRGMWGVLGWDSRLGVNSTGPESSQGPERGLRGCIGALNRS